MSNITPAITASQELLDHPLCIPIKIIAAPLIWIATKIKHFVQAFLGYFLELGVFSFGSWNRSWIKKKLIQLYKGGCYDTHDRARFDPKRLENAFRMMTDMGGIRSDTISKDGTKLDSMIIRYRDVKERIESLGGKFVNCMPVTIKESSIDKKILYTDFIENSNAPKDKQEYIDVILRDETIDPHNWKKFNKETLSKIGFEVATIKMKDGMIKDGYVLKHWKTKKPTRPKENQCFVRCNAPTESWPMAKRDIFRHVLGARSDMLCFDYRGTWKSEGVPSEGGYYLDAETMVEKAVNAYGYDYKDIWATGFCLGGSIAAHLYHKYHDKGINFFVQNTFDRMDHTLREQILFAGPLSRFALPALKSNDPDVYNRVHEDGFDTIRKLEDLRDHDVKNGISIIVNTDTDRTICPNSHQHLARAADETSRRCFSHMFKHPIRGKNGHSCDVLRERKIWDKVVDEITFKDHPEVFAPQKKGFFSRIPFLGT